MNSQPQPSIPGFAKDDREMLAQFLTNAAQAIRNGLCKDSIDLGMVASHLRSFLNDDEADLFDSSLEGCWSDPVLCEALQSGPHSTRWEHIAKLEPHLSADVAKGGVSIDFSKFESEVA
jgi:hypothetical protein